MGKQHARWALARDTALVADYRYNPFGSLRFAPFETDSATCSTHTAPATANSNHPYRALDLDGINLGLRGASPDNTTFVAESRDDLVRFSRRKPDGSTRGVDRQTAAGLVDRRHRAQATNFKLLLCVPGRFSLGRRWRSLDAPRTAAGYICYGGWRFARGGVIPHGDLTVVVMVKVARPGHR
jgi:hypothetical protein